MTVWNTAKEKVALAKGHALQDPVDKNNVVLPIEDHSDVSDAVATAHFVKSIPQSTVHAHIVKQAKRIGALHLVPQAWGGSKADRSSDAFRWVSTEHRAVRPKAHAQIQEEIQLGNDPGVRRS